MALIGLNVQCRPHQRRLTERSKAQSKATAGNRTFFSIPTPGSKLMLLRAEHFLKCENDYTCAFPHLGQKASPMGIGVSQNLHLFENRRRSAIFRRPRTSIPIFLSGTPFHSEIKISSRCGKTRSRW